MAMNILRLAYENHFPRKEPVKLGKPNPKPMPTQRPSISHQMRPIQDYTPCTAPEPRRVQKMLSIFLKESDKEGDG